MIKKIIIGIALGIMGWGFLGGGIVEAETETLKLNVPLGDTKEIFYDTGEKNSLLAAYTKTIYNYTKGIIVLLVTVMVIFGGIEWAFSGGSKETIARGKERIVSALIGLAVFIVAGLILQTINPEIFNIVSTDTSFDDWDAQIE